MTPGKIFTIGFIYVCAVVAWFILGASVTQRTNSRQDSLGESVGQLWGTVQSQSAPSASVLIARTVRDPKTKKVQTTTERTSLNLASSDVNVGLDVEHRRKGLLWYRTYRVNFSGRYTVQNPKDEHCKLAVSFNFPTTNALYDNFHFRINGHESATSEVNVGSGLVTTEKVAPHSKSVIEVTYRSQGMDRWTYRFGDGGQVSRVKGFRLTMNTDFRDIDFPANSLSPTQKHITETGWKLEWNYASLISGFQIGMEMPEKLNPGPLAARITYFAPVSLLFFFFVIFVISVLKGINLHPMHYFFLAGAFFAFHLLFAYLVDHILIHTAFVICAAVSILLVISYLRIVVGARFALIEAGLSQLLYLVAFSYAFFYKGFTGLTITLISILTLFVMMQLTARVDWDEKFRTSRNGKQLDSGHSTSPVEGS